MAITLEVLEDGIAVLQVNRPNVHNALNWQAMEKLAACVEEAHGLADLRALIVTGAGGSFIAGGDLKELYAHPTEADGRRLAGGMTHTLNRLEALPCPTIAAVNGPARGGGVEIALACDLRVLAEDASLGLVQVTLGLTPGWGAGQRLLHLAGYSRALEWLATGRIFSAREALEVGLANGSAPEGEALDEALRLARTIAKQPVGAVRALKRILRNGLVQPPATAAWLEQQAFPALWASQEHAEAVDRFLRRKEK